MGTQPLPELAHRGWLRSLRIFTALSLLLFLLIMVAVPYGPTIVSFAPWVLCCLVVLWRIRSNPPEKSGLALAVGVGCVAWIPSLLLGELLSYVLFLAFLEGDAWTFAGANILGKMPTIAYAGLFAIAQVGMVVSGIMTYYSLKREAGDRWKRIRGFASALILLVLWAMIVIPEVLGRERWSPESTAAASLRTIATANVTYSSTYNVGYAGDLRALGPSTAPTTAAADLLDAVLSGVNPATATPFKSGYRFTYAAPHPAPSPDQPNETFSVTATPVLKDYGGSTFCVDHTNVVGRDTTGKATSAPATGCPFDVFPPL